jgi:hypothetical protein
VDVRYIDEVDDRKYIFLINLSGLGGFGGGSSNFSDTGGRNSMFDMPYQVIRSQ